MADRPAALPVYNTNLTAIAVPDPTEQADGWPINTQPDRQIFNYIFGYLSLWLSWLERTQARPSDYLADDQILYAGTTLPAEFSDTTTDPPSWSGTRSTTVPASWFIGSAIVSTFRHGPLPFQGATFTNERDVYIDLDESGAWLVTEVANGAGAPAVGADSVRFFMFVTNASAQITDGTFYGEAYTSTGTPFDFAGGASIPRSGMDLRPGGDDLPHTLIHDAADANAGAWATPQTAAARVFLSGRGETPANLSSDDSYWWAIGVNCRYVDGFPTFSWANEDAAADSMLFVLHEEGLTILVHAAADGATWGDTVNPGTDWTVVGQYGQIGQGLNGGNLRVSAEGDVRVGRDVFIDPADSYAFLSARTITRTLSAMDFSAPGEGATGNWTLALTPGTPQAGGLTPNAATIGVTCGLGNVLPQGAVITGLWLLAVASGSDDIEAQVVRRAKVGSVNAQAMNAADALEAFNSIGAANTPVRQALAVDASAAIRTVDHATYTYFAVVYIPGAGFANIQFYGLEIQYTVTEVGL